MRSTRSLREVERFPRLIKGKAPSFRIPNRWHHRFEIVDLDGQFELRTHDLDRPSRLKCEIRAQRLVAAHQRVERSVERIDVERADCPKRLRHVIDRSDRQQLVENPEALLRKRRREDENLVSGRGQWHCDSAAGSVVHAPALGCFTGTRPAAATGVCHALRSVRQSCECSGAANSAPINVSVETQRRRSCCLRPSATRNYPRNAVAPKGARTIDRISAPTPRLPTAGDTGISMRKIGGHPRYRWRFTPFACGPFAGYSSDRME